MRNDEELTLIAAIDWFDESSFAADAVQLESMDFGPLLGDVVPRDGLQRPVLTSGSPVRARAALREGCVLGVCSRLLRSVWIGGLCADRVNGI
jgi:hypothetical protein